MSNHQPVKPRRVPLLERAAQAYDFGAVLRGDGAIVPALAEQAPLGPLLIEPSWRSAPMEQRRGTVAAEELREAGYILPNAAVTALAEEFRIVKRQLLLDAAGQERGRMILVASGAAGEGKTFCAVNLALSCAQEKDIEVVLVDADSAKPEVLATLGLEGGGPGLIDALADPAVDIEACLIRTDIPNLTVLPAGRTSTEATELLASERTLAVLDALLARNPNRLVIFDSPPALAASPASVLALVCGQALVVVRADRTPEKALRDTLSLLSGCRHIQLLLNAVEYKGSSRRFGSYYGHAE